MAGKTLRGEGGRLEARAKQHVHAFLGGKAIIIQQGRSVWVGLPKSGFGWMDGRVKANH
jgi:hypothetical protein